MRRKNNNHQGDMQMENNVLITKALATEVFQKEIRQASFCPNLKTPNLHICDNCDIIKTCSMLGNRGND